LHAQPLRIWLYANNDLPLIGKFLMHKETAYIAAWAATLFDVGIAFCLWFKKTRLAGYFLLSFFHIATALLFHIGMFPWIMMTAALLFFIDALPAKTLFNDIKRQWSLVPLALMTVWQMLFPLRHFMYPGNYLWTEQGFRFAWNIMLMEKNGVIDFGMKDINGNVQDVAEKEYLTPFQIKMVATQPDLICQFAQHIKQKHPGVTTVFAECYVSLNGRRSQLFFDPRLNLLTQPDELYKNIRLHAVAD
nr:HTTM domain-containing protein [Chitinophagaceae bacterium]